jgi:dolichol-phosphate mannosyltransferase
MGPTPTACGVHPSVGGDFPQEPVLKIMDFMPETTLSVIMPAYNEEESIALAVEEVQQYILNRVDDSELIVVDDGSQDSTAQILKSLSVLDSRIRVLTQENGGHGKALLSGLHEARGNFLFLLDSDRQIPAEAFSLLWRQRDGFDGVLGVRVRRQDPRLRVWLSRMIRIVIGLLFQVRLSDANCPFKLLRRSCWELSRRLLVPGTLAPSLFLAILLKHGGFKMLEVEVPHQERNSGTVTIRRWRLLKFCWIAFWQLIRFRYRPFPDSGS